MTSLKNRAIGSAEASVGFVGGGGAEAHAAAKSTKIGAQRQRNARFRTTGLGGLWLTARIRAAIPAIFKGRDRGETMSIGSCLLRPGGGRRVPEPL
ncbi:MAG: hypothetical protein ACREJ0_02940 [Geminicoccaceae bacterium]